MRRRGLVALLVTLVLGATASAKAEDLKPEEVYAGALPAIMTLKVEHNDGKSSIGTGFMCVKEGVAATAWHVVRGAKKVVAKFSSGEEFDVSGLIDKDEKRDVALVRVKVFGRKPLDVTSDDPKVGSKAFVIGAPRGLEFSFSDGLISQIQNIDGVKQFQFTCSASPGNSGGPLVNASGKVQGVVSWQVRDGQNLNFAVPISYVLGLDADPALERGEGGDSAPGYQGRYRQWKLHRRNHQQRPLRQVYRPGDCAGQRCTVLDHLGRLSHPVPARRV
jgi:S1-C subfamily serine protease